MKRNICFAALLMTAVSSTQAATIASWGFEVNIPPTTTGSSVTGLSPDVGSGSGSGVHANASTAFSTPVGNGSAHSFSANNWSIGDYWQFHVNTVGFQGIQLSFDQAAAGTGATNFNLLISTDGTTFTTALSFYGVPQNSTGFGGGGGVWNSTTSFSSYTHTVDLSSFTQLNNASDIYFRLQSNISGPGTSQIDNFIVSGLAVPEPGSVALIGAGVLLLIVNRQRQVRG
jgi:hypothetical protein